MKNLSDFLQEPRNSVFREKMLGYKLSYEIKKYSALNNPSLELFIPEIDRDGYDIILHDSIELRRFQIKTLHVNSATATWNIKKNLIRPKPKDVVTFNYEASPEGSGVGGGFILICFDIENNDVVFKEFYYTDVFILETFERDILIHTTATNQEVAKYISSRFKEVKSERGEKKDRDLKVEMRKSAMVKVDSLEDVMRIADLPGRNNINWGISLKKYKEDGNEFFRKEVVEKLSEIITDNRFKIQ